MFTPDFDQQRKDVLVSARIDLLEERVRRLDATATALGRLLAAATGRNLAEVLAAIDAEVKEQMRPKSVEELAKQTRPCHGCGRPVHPTLRRCQICGADVPLGG
jgi:rRNA maturation endonuclease Nob1